MLKGIPPVVNADLLWVLELMGHGDDLVLADRNFPSASVARSTVTGKLIEMEGCNCAEAAAAILSLFPLDGFVDEPIHRMEVVGDPKKLLDVHKDVLAAAEKAEGKPVKMGSIERHRFYDAARKAYAVVRTTEDRPYGCFILKKGVL